MKRPGLVQPTHNYQSMHLVLKWMITFSRLAHSSPFSAFPKWVSCRPRSQQLLRAEKGG
jgi:hypothetical protein